MKLIDLSHPLERGMMSFPGDPIFQKIPHSTILEEGCNVSQIQMSSHQGTHLDALSHFVPNGRSIDQMPLEWFYGPATVLRIPKSALEDIQVIDLKPFEDRLIPGARVLCETGWHKQYGRTEYFTDSPNLTLEAADYLAERQIRLLGMDMPTPSHQSREIHCRLQQAPAEMVIVESLVNLELLPDYFLFIGFPLPFQDGDGSPIRAVAVTE
jgi:kynurenine formamidase